MSRRTSHRNELLVGGLVLLSALIFTWMSIQVGALKSLGNTIRVTARFEDAAGLVEDAAVKVAGVKVGGVQDLDIDFDTAVVTLVLDADAGLRSDVRAQVRARSLLGEKFIALTPISRDAPLLADGDVIATIGTVDIDQLVTALGPLLAEIEPGDMARLVTAAGEILGTLQADTPALVGQAKTLLERLNEIASIAPALKTEVPGAIADVRRAARQLGATIERVDALLAKTDGVVDQAGGAMTDVGPALADVRALLAELGPGVDDLRAAMEQSDEAMSSLRKILHNVEGLDEEAVTRILREEGVLVRLKAPPPGKK
mgnify:CR=1 FL=1